MSISSHRILTSVISIIHPALQWIWMLNGWIWELIMNIYGISKYLWNIYGIHCLRLSQFIHGRFFSAFHHLARLAPTFDYRGETVLIHNGLRDITWLGIPFVRPRNVEFRDYELVRLISHHMYIYIYIIRCIASHYIPLHT